MGERREHPPLSPSQFPRTHPRPDPQKFGPEREGGYFSQWVQNYTVLTDTSIDSRTLFTYDLRRTDAQ